MPEYEKKYDLRIIRTNKALLDTLPRLLMSKKFSKLTVNDICEHAQLSRTAFYAHFKDKYELLEYWLIKLKEELLKHKHDSTQTVRAINTYVRENKKIISNLLVEANNETIELINKFMFQLVDYPLETERGGKPTARYTVLSNFCAGGLVNWLLWQIKHDFPSDLPMWNNYIVNMLELLLNKHD